MNKASDKINKSNAGCEYCLQTPVFTNGEYDTYESQKILTKGGWTGLYIGANKKGKIVLRACGDDYTDDLIIPFCPMCGKKLK